MERQVNNDDTENHDHNIRNCCSNHYCHMSTHDNQVTFYSSLIGLWGIVAAKEQLMTLMKNLCQPNHHQSFPSDVEMHFSKSHPVMILPALDHVLNVVHYMMLRFLMK